MVRPGYDVLIGQSRVVYLNLLGTTLKRYMTSRNTAQVNKNDINNNNIDKLSVDNSPIRHRGRWNLRVHHYLF